MVKMAEYFFTDEYDILEDTSIKENEFLPEHPNGVQLSCWGRQGHKMPKLSEIFVPRHVVIQEDGVDDPAFRRLSDYEEFKESFSFYDAIHAPQHVNLENNLFESSDPDEIYHSDSDFSTKSEDLSADGEDDEKVINTSYCKDEVGLNDEDNQSSEASNFNIPYSYSETKQTEITFEVEREDEVRDKSLEAIEENRNIPIANYIFKREDKDILFQPKKKETKTKKKNPKNKRNQIDLSEFETEEAKERRKKEHIDRLQSYYQNFDLYNSNVVPTESADEFPTLSPGTSQKKVSKSKQPNEEKQLSFWSVAEPLMPLPCQHESTQNENHQMANREKTDRDLLIIKNIPIGLSKDNLQFYLESFGAVEDLSLEDEDTSKTATVIMDCDLDWIIEALDGSSLDDNSTDIPLRCYKIEVN